MAGKGNGVILHCAPVDGRFVQDDSKGMGLQGVILSEDRRTVKNVGQSEGSRR